LDGRQKPAVVLYIVDLAKAPPSAGEDRVRRDWQNARRFIRLPEMKKLTNLGNTKIYKMTP
jgi:hypothetical protein